MRTKEERILTRVPKSKQCRLVLRVIILPKDETLQVYCSFEDPNTPALMPDPQVLPIRDGITLNASRLASRFGNDSIPLAKWVEVVAHAMVSVGPALSVCHFVVWSLEVGGPPPAKPKKTKDAKTRLRELSREKDIPE